MKRHYLIRLTFDTPVHFGAAEQGGTLEKIRITAKSDTLISALCTEAANIGGQESIDKLADAIDKNQLLISDLMPYYCDEKTRNIEYYLPKPILPPIEIITNGEPFSRIKQIATQLKKHKKMQYIRASEIADYLTANRSNKQYQATQRQFGAPIVTERVNCRGEQPLPYYVGAYQFAPQAGLYFIISTDDYELAEWIYQLTEQLGYSGIGGKRTSGYGKFRLEEDLLELDQDGITQDDQAIYQMLNDQTSKQQMLISCLLPSATDIDIIKQGTYNLIKRSGFYTDTTDNTIKKRNNIYMIDSGSCLPARIQGTWTTLIENKQHPIWRSGKGIYVGLPT